MDLFKSTFSDSKAEVELVIKPLGITMMPPPYQPVQVSIHFMRDSKLMFKT